MDGRFISHSHHHHFLVEQDYPTPLSETPRPPSDKMSRASPSKKSSRRSVQKRVVSIPIGDVDGSRTKGETPPPSDSWAWRKYGQKPIKGSPYPRGYYRCSSSKGCPARKQVERSRSDPTMLVITYACEHNHPWPTSRNAKNSTAHVPKSSPEQPAIIFSGPPGIKPEYKFADMESDASLVAEEFGWFSEGASCPTVDSLLYSPICMGSSGGEDVVEAMMLTMREEDESLFADLGELPECSVVFRPRLFGDEDSGRCSLGPAPFCGSTG